MKVIQKTEASNIATVYIAMAEDGRMVEFVEAVQPPYPVAEKWILMVSTLFGCPVKCKFCDAGGNYGGKLSSEEIMFQIDYLVRSKFPSGHVQVRKFKIQFARMGEPSFNPNVLRVLEILPSTYRFDGFLPSISTIAPNGRDEFFEELKRIKNRLYPHNFQLQFSIHSTDEEHRNFLMPIKKWDLQKVADFGKRFYNEGNRKITLNFALSEDGIMEPEILRKIFDPEKFLIKITPVNPTYHALKNNIRSLVKPDVTRYETIESLRKAGFEVILSIGEWEENIIGSNCGQYIHSLMRTEKALAGGYKYGLEKV